MCHQVMGPDAMIFAFWMLSFKQVFSVKIVFARFLHWKVAIMGWIVSSKKDNLKA